MKPSQASVKNILCRMGAAASVCLACALAHADTLELKNGQVLSGKYVGGTTATLRFETSGGVQTIETSQALALTFSGAKAATPAAATPTAAASTAPAAAAPAPAGVTVNAGTPLLVRLVDPVS